MRKVLSLLLGVLLIAALAVSAAADESGENAGTVPGTTEQLALDGVMDDAYQNGLCVEGVHKPLLLGGRLVLVSHRLGVRDCSRCHGGRLFYRR